jgi:DNA invertase Pin-like site-specific DNA recombinase
VSEINVAQPPLSEGCETVSGMGHLLGYARVSTTDQQPQLQVDALTAAGCYRVFTETASGARTDRPTLTQVLDQLRPGDTLVVWKLDRLGRSLRHLVDTVTGLAERGVGFCSLQEAIDTTTPGGKLVFHVFAALAEFEPDPRAHGRRAGRGPGPRPPCGRPSVLSGQKLQVAQEMYRSGQYTVAAIATMLGVSRASIYRNLTRLGTDHPSRLAGSQVAALPELPVVTDMAKVDLMASDGPQPMANLDLETIDDAQIVVEPDGAEVIAHMVIGAKAQDVGQHIRAVVGMAKRPDVCPFGVPPAAHRDRRPANLAGVRVEVLDPLDDLGAPNQALDRGRHSRRWPWLNCIGTWSPFLADELEPPDGEAGLSLGLPVLVDVVEAVIAKAAGRRVATGGVAATDHSHRQALAAALGQGRVAQGESLVGDLALGRWVVAALAGVDDEVAEVVVVFLASRDNDRVGVIVRTA